MTMQRTEGYMKAVVNVFYINMYGDKQHVMSFQLCTIKMADDPQASEKCFARIDECKADETKMQNHITAAIDCLRANEYQLSVEFAVEV